MNILRLVRHGEAAASYREHPDPGLSAHGRRQAKAAADRLNELRLDGSHDVSIVSSPMARARQTAAPLAEAWGRPVEIERAVSEIPSPGLSPAERGPWLQAVMAGIWDDASDDVTRWRDGIVEALLGLDGDTVVFSHYVAINAAISVATGAPALHCRHLDHCSVTTLDTSSGTLRLVEGGAEGETRIL